MVKLLDIPATVDLIQQTTLKTFFVGLVDQLKTDYERWHQFDKSPRHAAHFEHGVIELMPICDQEYYAFKYVNGHPGNPQKNKQTVVAVGMLSDVATGYPLMISEMTLLTACRTAAMSVLTSTYMARTNAKTMALIGTGSQAEFQVLAHHFILGINKIQYFDIDPEAMKKFANNLASYEIELCACADVESTLSGADIITTAIAEKKRMHLLRDEWIKPGMHINGIGGDCPGKTELDSRILQRAKIVVEYLPQTRIEGEIQESQLEPYAEIWQLVNGDRVGREDDAEVTVFDSVGFALEDYSVLKYVYQLLQNAGAGTQLHLVPTLDDPKNLFSLLT